MELRKLKLLVIIGLFLLMVLPNLVLADPNDPNDPNTWDDAKLIARTMREYQARWTYITGGGELSWPPGGCSYPPLDAPAFPPDEYYRWKCDNEPNGAMELVRDISKKFWYPDYRIWGFFVHHNYWDPSWTTETPERYNYDDFDGYIPKWYQVTETNYRAVCELIYDTVTKKFIVYGPVYCGLADCSPPDDCEPNVRSGHAYADRDKGEDCDDAKADANSDWASSGWEDFPGWWCDYYYKYRCPGVKEYTWDYEEYNMYEAGKWAYRFKLGSDLTNLPGTAKCYIRIEAWGGGYSNLDAYGMVDGNEWQTNAAQHWGSPTAGQDWMSDYLANVEPEFTTNCPREDTTHGWRLVDSMIYILPAFDANSGGCEDDPDPDLYVYKNKVLDPCDPNVGDYIVYSANPECCPISSYGETVDGNIVPAYEADEAMVVLSEKYSTKAAILYINGWNGNGTALTDPNKAVCLTNVKSLPFNVKALQGETEISFKVTFWREDDPNCYWSEIEVTIKVEPTEGDLCCREESCELESIEASKAEEDVSCLISESEDVEIWIHDNDDIEVRLPDRGTESYIMYTPSCGFLSGWEVTRIGSDVNIVDNSSGVVYEVRSSSPYKLTAITDFGSNTLVTFEYDAYGRLEKQKDGTDPNYYIAYDYNDLTDYNDRPETITAQAYDVNRVYTIEYDSEGRVVAMASASCDCCGGVDAAVRYVFNDDNLVVEKRSYDTNEVIYEYVYDSQKRRIETWLGPKSDGNCVQKVFYTDYGDGLIVDTYDYVDPYSYRVMREYQNSAGLVTKQVSYDSLDEDPGDPAGYYFIEHIVYEYDANGLVEKRTLIPPSAGLSEPPDPLSGIRKEYTYDPNTGSMLTEKWFDRNEANFTVSEYTYEYIWKGDEIINVRVKDVNDARGAVTEYYYDGNEVIPKTTIMPQVSTGISGTQRLKYEYTYDIQNRVTLEKQLDDSNNLLARTQYIYDNAGNLVMRYDYDDYTDGNEITLYEYNGFNEMIMVTLPSKAIRGRSYYDSGKVEYEVVYDPCDPNYAYSQTAYYYDGNGRLEEIVKADDPNVFPIDNAAKWIRIKYEYDLRGNKTKVIEDVNGLSLVTTYEYNHQGQVTKVTLPNGKWTETVRDGRGLVYKTIVGYGETTVATTEFYYDNNGNLEWQIAPNGIKTRYEYDDFDRVIRVTKGL